MCRRSKAGVVVVVVWATSCWIVTDKNYVIFYLFFLHAVHTIELFLNHIV